MCVTAEEGPQQCKKDTNTPFCPLLFGLEKFTMYKADTWFLFSKKQDSISSCSISLFLWCMNYASIITHIQMSTTIKKQLNTIH